MYMCVCMCVCVCMRVCGHACVWMGLKEFVCVKEALRMCCLKKFYIVLSKVLLPSQGFVQTLHLDLYIKKYMI